MASLRELTRCRERLEGLGGSNLDCESVQREAISELARVVGFDRWCWPFADPRTLVPLGGIADHDYGPRLRRALELEFSGADFAAKHLVARRPSGVGSLGTETGGDLGRSPRWDEVMRPFGIGDVAAAACRDSFGCWGWIEAYRDSGDRPFDDDELELLASAGRSLASVLRRGLGGRIDGRAAAPLAPGVVVLGPDLNVRASTPQASAWFELLPAAPLFALWNMLPGTIYPVAALARSPESAEVAHALELGVDGRWVMIEAAPLEGSDQGEIAVVLRDARPPEIFDLLCRTYALTRRERDVAAAVLAGFDTRAISERLFISRHTVQDHLKSVFEKVGISSRRELVATFNA